MSKTWTIFYSFHDKAIHLDSLKKSNPNATIIPLNIKNKYPSYFAWRNCDLLVRNEIKKYYSKIKTNNIALVEYDVLINEELPDTNIESIFCKNIKYKHIHKNWCWFKEINRLDDLKDSCIGILPFALIFMNFEHLKILLDKKYDNLYEKDIISELRLGTIFNSAGCDIKEYNYPNMLSRQFLKNNKITEYELINRQDSKIYHPVKNHYEI